jgi:hypothetical protein
LNFKFIYISIFILLSSCGLKKYPKSPHQNSQPDLTEQYKFQYEEDKAEKREKKA